MSKPRVAVIDYGVGNLLSVQRALEYCGAEVELTSNLEAILAAERVVLPGVGAFAKAMQSLHKLGLVNTIRSLADKQTPMLGICLGMQLLLDESEEFVVTKGLGLIPGRVVPVPTTTITGEAQKVPHIGWNELVVAEMRDDWSGSLLQNNRPGEAAYFVHSFMVSTVDPQHRIADCLYGGHRISAAIARGHISGCQFHPEKSGEVGLRILSNFCGN